MNFVECERKKYPMGEKIKKQKNILIWDWRKKEEKNGEYETQRTGLGFSKSRTPEVTPYA